MNTPTAFYEKLKKGMKREWKIAFLAAVILGMVVHMPIMVSDIPNHDGLDSMYFDQNMIISGRWFLTIACGFSSYFTVPWLIGVLGILFLSLTAVALTELLELKRTWSIVLVSGLLVAFPALASTFAYVFTLDGYMLALLLAVLAVLLTKKYQKGFVAGGICLAFSLGTYQAYLSFAMLLCIYCVVICLIETNTVKEKVKSVLHYLYMGVFGGGFYFLMLQILLKIQGKEIGAYQIENGGSAETVAKSVGLLSTVKEMYVDFLSFSLKGNVFISNVFSILAILVLVMITVFLTFRLCFQRKWWKNPAFFVIISLLVVGLPLATNVLMLILPNMTYHLLMRYQWVLYPILFLAFGERYTLGECCCDSTGSSNENSNNNERDALQQKGKGNAWIQWALLIAGAVMVFHYAVVDNIAYSNLDKRYEKTYAYCVRLLDRIEQTEGYYQGIPIAMIGVVGEEAFPATDITGDVTGGMIGIGGDSLLYTGDNYQEFIKHYLGATLNILEAGVMSEIYYSEEYKEMDSFPGANSTKVVDGILYVKTENAVRE